MASRGDPNRGQLVVISGPSGVGKTALGSLLMKRYQCRRAVTATTREPRPGERDGLDYCFLDREAFLEGVQAGRFLEHAEVHGHLYGTPVAPLEEQLLSGGVVLLTIDVQGAGKLMEQRSPATFVFIEPPDMEELKRRLVERGSDDADAIALRLENAHKEMLSRDRYNFCVVNGEMETAVTELGSLLGLKKRES
ncbi:MAG: guanylate kinase [Planctomycetota bacterium]